MRIKTFSTFAATGVLIAACNQQEQSEQATAVQPATGGTAQQCASLTSLALPNTTITLAESGAPPTRGQPHPQFRPLARWGV